MTDDATYRKMKQERDLALAECERLNDTLDKLVQWSDAYPIAVFPEPDFLKAQKVLSEKYYHRLAMEEFEKIRALVGDENHEKQKYRLAEELLDKLVINDKFIEFLTIPGYKYL